MKTTIKRITEATKKLMKRLPAGLREQVLLTGGSAAFLYGSDRPFSNDMDFMVPAERISEIEKALGVSFTRHLGKPIFHSLKAVFEEGGLTCDLVAESVIDPTGHDNSYTVKLTEKVLRKKGSITVEGQTLNLVPRELLVLIKLLAGRGEELRKYDLYDAEKIIEKSKNFDFPYFVELIKEFCPPVKKSLPVLIRNAEKTDSVRLLEVLKSLQPSS